MTSHPDASDGAELTIREADRADLLAVFRIEKAVFPQPWPFASFEQFLGNRGFLVALRDGAVVGYAIADLRSNNGRDLGHLKDIAVHPEAQGEGVGRALLRRVLFTLAVAGAAVVKLEVREENDVAQSLYEDVGFERVRRVPAYYDDGEDAYVMVLDVAEWQN
ncbi:ribosomal protein S18-alanine N-acetyltransferase [Halolamina sp. CBA1230]|uniref:ribosomal protein S18-alanine N-acetyltransferase n=1 Tax=Halolamina sp. CBA1230 TaxID=1853690 RepID=UPI0009A18B9C|nr:ribosomal protein S18-alanine N-acetyltransferase [Halolamina sp. CBA1230]QKY20063.1 ribosomal protein S18-alanine N-acetyltransferase [Halolamina sp. CBA1230]